MQHGTATINRSIGLDNPMGVIVFITRFSPCHLYQQDNLRLVATRHEREECVRVIVGIGSQKTKWPPVHLLRRSAGAIRDRIRGRHSAAPESMVMS